jgi:hypothetical protein
VQGEEILFAVRDAKKGTAHLDGRVQPLGSNPKAAKSSSKTAKTGGKTK